MIITSIEKHKINAKIIHFFPTSNIRKFISLSIIASYKLLENEIESQKTYIIVEHEKADKQKTKAEI